MIRDRMTKEFVRLSTDESLASGRTLLGASEVAVIWHEGEPVTVVRAIDLDRLVGTEAFMASLLAQFPVGIFTRDDYELDRWADMPELAARELGASGVMVVDGKGELVGVLTLEAIDDYLEAFESQEAMHKGPRDFTLPTQEIEIRFVIYCEVCDYKNKLSDYDRYNPSVCLSPANQDSHTIR